MIYSITEIEARYAETDKMGVIYHGIMQLGLKLRGWIIYRS
ncbi:4-hydroxybenzoyl-CoA thioesterase family active site protein [Staphylococcus aureus]|nr:4-hydroxybenzoyl-CoA thioesterase family active site protein [Staphylococcus aureus]